MIKLSGDYAHELFMSDEPFPLHIFLEQWKAGQLPGIAVGYVLSVVGAYNHAVANCADGRYGKART